MIKRLKYIIYFSFTILFSFSQQYEVPVGLPSEGLIAWWPFNTNADDSSGNGYNGTVQGARLCNDRFNRKKNAFSFDGLGDYISVEVLDENLMLSDNFTISMWVNVAFTGKDQYILSKGDVYSNEFALLYRKTGELVFEGPEHPFQSPVGYGLNYNVWSNVVLVVESGSVRLYVNGNWISTSILPIPILPSGLPLVFGARFQAGTVTPLLNSSFNGKLDDIIVWKRPLEAAEIKELAK
jgi:hypothetical protein